MTLAPASEPIERFAAWYRDAADSGLKEPTAVALGTADASGQPSVRMVLLKGFDAAGFTFFTNTESRKGRELAANPRAALCFYWMPLGRSIRVVGRVEPVSAAEADAYYATRHRSSQIGAWASKQSRPLESRFELEKRVAEFGIKHAIGTVPRPPYWSGFRIVPATIEFWEERPFRLHDRQAYAREGDGWRVDRLYP
ncbi:MAG: pyridoxamine 5'-phosphate oxidase [Alphaproteobacteria bacterium]|nr:pyridoxamine 5'-phosphate oxidase [Alphaproteobacteria bacterium]